MALPHKLMLHLQSKRKQPLPKLRRKSKKPLQHLQSSNLLKRSVVVPHLLSLRQLVQVA